MKILYAGNFDLSDYAGRNRATRQKLQALGGLGHDLKFFSVSRKPRVLGLLATELKCFYYILINRPDVFVSRGNIGLLAMLLCKALKCKTFREIHADRLEEIKILDANIVIKSILNIIARYTLFIDHLADVRIFNHPQLMSWYDKKYGCGTLDFYCYNGFEPETEKKLSKQTILAKYNLSPKYKYLIFTGSASQWHGVEYLVNLQIELNKINSEFKIICAGGLVGADIDPDNVLINISPLDDKSSDELISIATACLLPVNNSRVSPGSPLKLYDYIKNGSFVITQKNVLGYSDEVIKYGRGICVDFLNAKETAQLIGDINYDKPISESISNYSWKARMSNWIHVFEKASI